MKSIKLHFPDFIYCHVYFDYYLYYTIYTYIFVCVCETGTIMAESFTTRLFLNVFHTNNLHISIIVKVFFI